MLAALVPFWAVKGTEPASHLALWFLYGGLVASAFIWAGARVLAWRQGRNAPSRSEQGPVQAGNTYITESHDQSGGSTTGHIENKDNGA